MDQLDQLDSCTGSLVVVLGQGCTRIAVMHWVSCSLLDKLLLWELWIKSNYYCKYQLHWHLISCSFAGSFPLMGIQCNITGSVL